MVETNSDKGLSIVSALPLMMSNDVIVLLPLMIADADGPFNPEW